MKSERIKKTVNDAGNEVISILDDAGEEGMSITMESIFEARELEELDATNILSKPQVEELKEVPKPRKRLDIYNQYLVHKETGAKYLIKFGNIPKIEERIEEDITGSFLIVAHEATPDVQLSLLVPYKDDGNIVETFNYELREDE